MNFVLLDAPAAGDELDQTTNISAHVADVCGRKTVF
jgi:hypothetical protein